MPRAPDVSPRARSVGRDPGAVGRRHVDGDLAAPLPAARVHRRGDRRARQRPRDRRELPRRDRRARVAGRDDRARGAVHGALHGRRTAADGLPAVRRVHPDLGWGRAGRDRASDDRRRSSRRSRSTAVSSSAHSCPVRPSARWGAARPARGCSARITRSASAPRTSPARRSSARCACGGARSGRTVTAAATVAPSVPRRLRVQLQLHALCTRVTR